MAKREGRAILEARWAELEAQTTVGSSHSREPAANEDDQDVESDG